MIVMGGVWRGKIDELGRIIQGLCQVIPEGMICFFPSYQYLEQVQTVWNRQGWTRDIQRLKSLFVEPRTVAVDTMLGEYQEAARKKEGAIMLCVVGGKLSEGINFSDHLGR